MNAPVSISYAKKAAIVGSVSAVREGIYLLRERIGEESAVVLMNHLDDVIANLNPEGQAVGAFVPVATGGEQ